MKAVVLEDAKKLTYREDYPKPIPGPDDVIVKVRYCGVCGSDVTNWKYKLYQVPLIMGHEFTGEIAELGANVKDWKVGDRVCGINVALKVGETAGMGVFQDGGYAEYVKAPKHALFSPPDSVSLKDAVFIESYANAFRAIKHSKIEKNEKIIVIGVGPIGLSFLDALIKERKPEYVIAIELSEYLRDQAKNLGADDVFPPNKVKIRRFMKKHGTSSYIFDCAGAEASLKMAIDLIKKGGTIVLEGLHRGNIDFPLMLMNTKEICLKGIISHDREDILTSIKYFEEGKFDASKFATEVISLKDVPKHFDRFLEPEKREFVKMMIEM